MARTGSRTPHALVRRVVAVTLVVAGALLSAGGTRLALLGGSLYYVLAGLALGLCGVLHWRSSRLSGCVYALFLVATIVWSLAETGADGWPLLPRLVVPMLLGAGWIVHAVDTRALRTSLIAAASIAAGLVLHALGPPSPVDPVERAGLAVGWRSDGEILATPAETSTEVDWRHYGNDPGGSRFSALTQIDRDNVDRLQPVWTYRTGDLDTSLQVTPLMTRGTVFLCTGRNDVIALDAVTGRERWRHDSGADVSAAIVTACRGVAWYQVPDGAGPCAERIYTNTIDARLIALDARTGRPCPGFGVDGTVSLLRGMADSQHRTLPGYYYVTSAPTIVRGRIVLGGWVADAQYWGEPSGVIRAYDAVTGDFAWAFDMGRPDRRSEPPPGEQYTPSTPNAWAPMSADETLGLVFVPTGNTTGSDYYGGLRREFDERYSSSVLALDARTGDVRWSFQTVHHDLWDYDVAPQPVAVDLEVDGGTRRWLIQATKTGEVFVLDRESGLPAHPVVEHEAPLAGAAADERPSRTQPVSISLPSFRGPFLEERDMWGLSPFDQLWCRIRYREARYDGLYTPPGPTSSIQYPGILGGMEWGGVSVDPVRALMFVNASRIANYVRLIPREEADAEGRQAAGLGGEYLHRAQLGTPYAVSNPPFLSPLGIPCQRPPFGTMSAVDLRSGRLVWTRWLGTARDSGPFGVPSMLPLPIGTPNIGGSLATAGGVVFIGATQDRYLRAFDADSGRLLWKARLPAAALATPMTYRSGVDGRQYVVVAAGGSGHGPASRGDYVMAYALPRDEAADSHDPRGSR